ncbi:LemA family protein [Baekduia soli]|uniref:LemA family protein n=1 Tax=Baekduia soli TaxID=496014 RepID=A0A5B8U139_9ACTN|nr:LemA family protein [Baekduia soli]QEC46642.1 LemA family protein [Baekduia soli]
MVAVYAGLGAFALVAAWLVTGYQGLVAARNRAEGTWNGIEAQLQRRHALLPELADAVAALAPGETEVLGRLERARLAAQSAGSAFERADAERRVAAALGALGALVQTHPALGAGGTFVELQTRLARIDDDLQASRRLYNADVRLYLTRRRRFPPVVLVGMERFPERPYFELDQTRERILAVA